MTLEITGNYLQIVYYRRRLDLDLNPIGIITAIFITSVSNVILPTPPKLRILSLNHRN